MDKLGIRIKTRREAIHQSLSELGKTAGVSSSLLSQIEHGKASPSLRTLKSIADALNTTVGSLVGENETIANNPVIELNNRKLVKNTEHGATLYMLSNYSPAQNMETLMVRLENHGNCTGLTESSRHAQEFCHVISGSIEITLSHKTYILQQGDSIYFDSKELNSIINLQNGVSDFLWIVSAVNTE